MDTGRIWFVPLSGILFVALVVAAFLVVGEEPPSVTDDPVGDIVDFYEDKESEATASAFLAGLAAATFVVFAGYLRRFLVDGGSRGASLVAFGGALIFATGVAIDATLTMALAETADDVDPTAVQTLSALFENDFIPMAVGLLLWLGGTGVAILRSANLPSWLGWAAIALAIFGLTPLWFVPFIGGALLILVLSVMLTLRARSPQTR